MYWGYELNFFLLIKVRNQNNLETTVLADGKSVFFFFPLICHQIMALLNSALCKYSLPEAFRHCVMRGIHQVIWLNTPPPPQ